MQPTIMPTTIMFQLQSNNFDSIANGLENNKTPSAAEVLLQQHFLRI